MCYNVTICSLLLFGARITQTQKGNRMLTGVYLAKKKDGSLYYRSNITYRGKHISLGSFDSEQAAHLAYLEAASLLESASPNPSDGFLMCPTLGFDKVISLMNFRDNHIYIKTPIYLKNKYFLYFLSPAEELKFDIDDLFFYSSHRILRRQGHLYVNDYGMQISLLSRYGIKSYAVAGKDYEFANGDPYDFRYSNLIILSRYSGVSRFLKNGVVKYRVQLHIRGNHTIGIYSTEIKAAIAYNKAADLAGRHGIRKNFAQNYIPELSAKEYADIYTKLRISGKFLSYLQASAGK